MASPKPQTHLPPAPPAGSTPKPTLLPSPFQHPDDEQVFDPEPVQATTTSIFLATPDQPDDGQYPYPEGDTGSLLPPPNFAPLFTLIKDTSTGEFVHPAVYYVFDDDEADTMSTAALHALDSYCQDISKAAQEEQTKPPDVEVDDRYVVIDLTRDATNIQAATSLSHKWAVTDAKMSLAPIFGGGDEDGGGGLMLVVEGLSVDSAPKQESEGDVASRVQNAMKEMRMKHGGNVTEAMSEIFATMADGLDVMDKMIGAE